MSNFDDESKAIDKAVFQLLAEMIKNKNSSLIAKDNVFYYQHGATWTHVSVNTDRRNEGNFKEQSVEVSVSASRILENDANVIPEFVSEMAEKMHGKFATSVYSTIGDAAESVGNSLQFEAQTGLTEQEEAIAMRRQLNVLFERLELSVDQYGAVSYPSLHVHPENTKMIKALSLPETEEEARTFYEVQRRKEAEALGREAARLARYVRRK